MLISGFDFAISSALSSFSLPILDRFMVFTTRLGDGGFIWILLCIILLFFPRTRRCGAVALCALAATFVVSQWIVKPIFMRARPFEVIRHIALLIEPPHGSSFPSSHSATSFACASAVWLFNKKIGAFALILSVLIAFSRLYLCVHFLSDVVVGALLGVLIGFVAYKIGGSKK